MYLTTFVFHSYNHIQIFIHVVETIALGLMKEATSGSSGSSNSDQILSKALVNSDYLMDFIIGLSSLLHPSQINALLLAYFKILQRIEDPTIKGQGGGTTDASNLRCSKCAKQIRLHAVERLAAMPTFARLNFPVS